MFAAPVCGTYGDWSDWTECDQPCGPGLQYRFRESLLDQDEMGIVCPPDVESDDCNIQECGTSSQICDSSGSCKSIILLNSN